DAREEHADSGRAGSDADSGPSAADGESPDHGGDGQTLDVSFAGDGAVDASSDGGGDATDENAASGLGRDCVEVCVHDVDCCTGDAGCLPIPGGHQCDTQTHRCVQCRNDLTCKALASQWFLTSCVTADDCAAGLLVSGDVCVDVDGSGYCAF